MGWIITRALEPKYVDDVREESTDCIMCPCSEEECAARSVCYWDEVWGTEEQEVCDEV